MDPKQQSVPTTPATPKSQPLKEDKIHWCGHPMSHHDGEDGMCRHNNDSGNGCDCGGIGDE